MALGGKDAVCNNRTRDVSQHPPHPPEQEDQSRPARNTCPSWHTQHKTKQEGKMSLH